MLTEQDKADASERVRVAQLLGQIRDDVGAKRLLDGYCASLLRKCGAGLTSMRSVRLALSPAVRLLQLGSECSSMPPTQTVLSDYLARTPGQRAAVSGFVNFLRREHSVDLVLPPPIKTSALAERKVAGEKLARLLAGGISDDKKRRRALKVALCYFNSIDKRVAGMMSDLSAVTINNAGDWALICNGRSYWLPSTLAASLVGERACDVSSRQFCRH